MRKTLKKRIKAGVVSRINKERRLRQMKRTINSLPIQQDISNRLYQDYIASMFIPTLKARRYKTNIGPFYNNLVILLTQLRKHNPDLERMTTIKNDILRTMPDDITVAEYLNLPTLYPQIALLREKLSNETTFPPQSTADNSNLTQLINSILDAIHEPISERVTNIPLVPRRQKAFHTLGQGRKHKSQRLKRRK